MNDTGQEPWQPSCDPRTHPEPGPDWVWRAGITVILAVHALVIAIAIWEAVHA